MASKKNNAQKEKPDIALEKFHAGYGIAYYHPILFPILRRCHICRHERTPYPANGLAKVSQRASIYCHPKALAEPKEWARAIAHCALHLAMEHFQKKENPALWNIACDFVVEKFLAEMKIGPPDYANGLPQGVNDEEKLYEHFLINGVPDGYKGLGTAGNDMDILFDKPASETKWATLFAEGLIEAVAKAVDKAADHDAPAGANPYSAANRAKSWFISNYPLLGAIAASFAIIEDMDVCRRMEISVAAVSCAMREIYINPLVRLGEEELRFVIAHELLHAALRHDIRHEWRDAYLWNVACDYVINGWLTEMGIGERPDGLLYDEQFKGLNAENIYDQIVTDMRRYRKLATLRGVGMGDILPGDVPGRDGEDGFAGDGVSLDEFYRRAFAQGLEYHQRNGRGYLPEGLVEEIRALTHPPIPWDVDLASWFDEMFLPLEKQNSYARPSRRQSSTPDIPRPSRVLRLDDLDGRTFGVVLDTSGSMERRLLAVALGAIASYSAARDVPGVRVVFCDAEAYDQGYLKPEDIAGTVKVKGRGGTVLQPGIDLLLKAEDFPKEAPLLIITDGGCEDRLILSGREHAFLIPAGATLPFSPKGKVFRMRL